MSSRSSASEADRSSGSTLTPEYWAFISYSHRDAAIAARVQRALETYRIPRRLEGRPTPAGLPAPRYFKPVFRDRDDLQASPDLKARVDAALAGSRYLVVICSPAAAESTWVNDEIREFKRVHGDQRILALIADGEPFASERADNPAAECFPEALRFDEATPGRRQGDRAESAAVRQRAAEPIAADLRPQGDGERLATLKLVAGMLGVGVDTLVRRDAQRRNRRMARVAFASLCGVIVMSALTFVALKSRNEAQRERAQAESLVEFMLTDLRKKLDQVGRLDILDGVGGKALAYYAEQPADTLDAVALGQRARAQHLIGEMREQRGQLDAALEAFRDAEATTARSLAQNPNDPQRIYVHAQSEYWVALIAWRRGQADAADAGFREYARLADRLVALDPGNSEWQMEKAYAAQNLGVFQLDRGDVTQALASFERALVLVMRVGEARPENISELAELDGWIAQSLYTNGQYAKAIDRARERLARIAAGSNAAGDRQLQRQIGNARLLTGMCEYARGNLPAAEQAFAQTVAVFQAMVAVDPANHLWQTEEISGSAWLARTRLAMGKVDEARRELPRIQILLDRAFGQSEIDVRDTIYIRGLALDLKSRLEPLSLAEARAYTQSAESLQSAGRVLSSTQLLDLANGYLMVADASLRERQLESGQQAILRAIQTVKPFASREMPEALLLIARAENMRGNAAASSAALDAIATTELRSPDLLELQRVDHAHVVYTTRKGDKP